MARSGSYKYLYERLGEKRFQQLCAALVVDRFEDAAVFPVGERDGGRDMSVGTGSSKTILQVKWVSTRSRRAATWLKSAVAGEDANIRRLVSEGCRRYVLMTNVEGGAAPKKGSRDEVETALTELGAKYGIQMSCVWASDLDAWVDLAPFELKAAYVDMLAGTDALIALLHAERLEGREQREKDILVTYTATQWDRDKRVKFRQVDLRSDLLTELFVDVTGRRIRSPRNLPLPTADIGGVGNHLLNPKSPPLTLIEGIPGQGKSTVVQYVSQVHRAGFIGRKQLSDGKESLPQHEAQELRVAVRLDLADYAEWIEGHDPFMGDEASVRKTKPRSRVELERFLVEHLEASAPGHEITIEDVRSILDRFPTQIVFDGLDEVASPSLRATVVQQIDGFTSRWVQSRPGNMRIVVTTRPNASGLPEPATDIFEKITLQPLEESTKKRYLRRWAGAQHIDGPELRRLEQLFGARTAAPHVAQLAENPMQLTILLHLLRTKGESLPTARTSLYRSYMDLFLERESVKSKLVLQSRADLEEATSYLGWLMQALTEVDASSTRLPAKRIIREMQGYLAGVGKADVPVQALFEAMRDRVWVLTSKQSGTYEFDVQSIREFFAARFLYDFAEADPEHEFEPEAALMELLPRAYWSNTARFLAGHLRAREVPNLAELIEHGFKQLPGARQFYSTVWALLSDGIFKERTASQRRVATLFAGDLPIRFLAEAMITETALPVLPSDYGGSDLAEHLRASISAEVTSPLTAARSIVAAAVGDPEDYNMWWKFEIDRAAATESEAAWLEVGRPHRSGQDLEPATVAALTLDSAAAARAALSAGVTPAEGSPNAARLLEWVLDGHCSDVCPEGTSEAADLLRVVAPRILIAMAPGANNGGLSEAGHQVGDGSQSQRTAALRRLAERHGHDRLQKALRNTKGQKGTTSRWVNSARTLSAIYGRPTWLATELASIAAAIPPPAIKIGGDLTKGAPCFGPDMDYGQWLPKISINRAREAWWAEQAQSCTDAHSKAAWVLGLLVAADAAVIFEMLPELSDVAASLPDGSAAALLATSSRIGSSGIPRRLQTANLDGSTPTLVRLLLSHFSDDPASVIGTEPATIVEAAALGAASWPAAKMATQGALNRPTPDSLDLVAAFGPIRIGPTASTLLPAEAATHILASPGRFPASWLTLADTSQASSEYSTPLKNVADTRWGI